MTEPTEFPINLMAFCRLVVEWLGYQNTDHVLNILDENFPVVQDRALDCNFDQRLAYAILAGEKGEGETGLVTVALILPVIAVFVALSLARIGPIPVCRQAGRLGNR